MNKSAVGVPLGYTLLTMLFLYPAILTFSTRIIGAYGDASFFMMDMWHFKYAVDVLGRNPFNNTLLYWPYGVNELYQNGLLFRMMAYCLTPKMGLVGIYNLLIIQGIVLGGVGMYLLARELKTSRASAFIAGAVFSLGPTTAVRLHLGSGPDALSLGPVAFFVWLLYRSLKHEGINCFFTAMALSWIWLCHYYYFIFAVIILALSAAINHKAALKILGAYVWLNFYLIVAVIYLRLNGDSVAPSTVWHGGGNPTDLLTLLHPTKYNIISIWAEPGIGFVGTSTLLAIWAGWHKTNKSLVLLAVSLFSVVMVLGPWLRIHGFNIFVPLPFYFMHLLPIFSSLQNGCQFYVFVTLFFSALLALSLDRLPKTAVVAFCVAAFIEFIPITIPTHELTTPKLFERLGQLPDGAMLPIPVGASFDGLDKVGFIGKSYMEPHWMIAHHKPMVGGIFGRVTRKTMAAMKADKFFMALVEAQKDQGPVPDSQQAAQYFKEKKIRYVLVFLNKASLNFVEKIDQWPMRPIDIENGMLLYATNE